MSLVELKKSGWFKKQQEITLPELSQDQLNQIKLKKEVIISQEDDFLIIFIKDNANLKSLKIEDIVIKKIPNYF